MSIQHTAQKPLVDPLPDGGVEMRVAQFESDLKKALCPLGRERHRLSIGQSGGHRLFAHHSLTGFKRGNCQIPVGVVGRGDVDKPYLRILQDLIETTGRLGPKALF